MIDKAIQAMTALFKVLYVAFEKNPVTTMYAIVGVCVFILVFGAIPVVPAYIIQRLD